MITFVTSGLAVFWMVVSLSRHAGCDPSFRVFWFSQYGPAGYGRVLSEGADLGQLTLIQCSRFCSDKGAACMALQFHRTTGKTGTCYIFPSLTYNAAMIASPGHRYLEKRVCEELYSFTAGVLYPTDNALVLFSGETTLVFAIEGMIMDTIPRLTLVRSHALIFPGLTGEVDGAFVGPFGHTYIVQGSRLRCYTPVNATKTLFEECSSAVDTDILSIYFAYEDRLDAITSLDNNTDYVYVLKDDMWYTLLWNQSVYVVIDLYPSLYGLTDVTNFKTTGYLLVSDVTVMWYNSMDETVSSIFNVCRERE